MLSYYYLLKDLVGVAGLYYLAHTKQQLESQRAKKAEEVYLKANLGCTRAITEYMFRREIQISWMQPLALVYLQSVSGLC